MYAQEIMQGMPGVGATGVASYKKIYRSKQGVQYLPGGGVIDGNLSRDPSNVVAGNEESVNDPTSISDITTLRAGLLMGRVKSSGKFAPSVYGLLTQDLGGGQTSLYMSIPTATEIARRRGTATVAAVNQVEALPVVDNTGSGTFTLTIEGMTTGAITYSATVATLITRINSALDALFGSSAIVASGASLAALILTFSGTGYTGRAIVGHATVTLDATLLATGTVLGGVLGVSTTTTPEGAAISAMFKLTGPATPGGTVRTKTVTCSNLATATGIATITATAAAITNAVNQIEALPMVDVGAGSGTYYLTIEGITTAAITFTHSDSAATTYGLINAALNAAFGTSAIVASGANLASIILTFSGTGYAGRPINGHVDVTFGTLTTAIATIGGAGTGSASTTTTAGVTAVAADSGEFVAGSLIQPVDGSETIKTILDQEDGIHVTLNGTGYDASFPHIPIGGGVIDVKGITNYMAADTAVQTWIKAALKAVGPFLFDDDV